MADTGCGLIHEAVMHNHGSLLSGTAVKVALQINMMALEIPEDVINP